MAAPRGDSQRNEVGAWWSSIHQIKGRQGGHASRLQPLTHDTTAEADTFHPRQLLRAEQPKDAGQHIVLRWRFRHERRRWAVAAAAGQRGRRLQCDLFRLLHSAAEGDPN
jgi:hypothetical protein